jgi:5'-3' exonuclease
MIALIDSDIVAYRCAAACELEPEDMALLRTHEMMQNIIDEVGAKEYRAFLSGPNNFRYKINPDYKANRKDKEKPKYLQACRDYLVREWHAEICDGYEADDALGMAQDKEGDEEGSYDTVICSIDKDLLMIPGFHYNFVKKEFLTVTYLEGMKHYFKQMLIGDPIDNIFGVKGIGKVKAAKLIDHLDNAEHMYLVVRNLYDDMDRFSMNSDCLWIKQAKDEVDFDVDWFDVDWCDIYEEDEEDETH